MESIFNMFNHINNMQSSNSSSIYQIWVDHDVKRMSKIANIYKNSGQIGIVHSNCLFELINDKLVYIFINIGHFLLGLKIHISLTNDIKIELLDSVDLELKKYLEVLIQEQTQISIIILSIVDFIICNVQNYTKELYFTTFQTINFIQSTILEQSQFLPIKDYYFRKNIFRYRLLIEKLNRLSLIFENFYKLEDFYHNQIQIDNLNYYLSDFKPVIMNQNDELLLKFNHITSKEKIDQLRDVIFRIRMHLSTPIEKVLEEFYQIGEQNYFCDSTLSKMI